MFPTITNLLAQYVTTDTPPENPPAEPNEAEPTDFGVPPVVPEGTPEKLLPRWLMPAISIGTEVGYDNVSLFDAALLFRITPAPKKAHIAMPPVESLGLPESAVTFTFDIGSRFAFPKEEYTPFFSIALHLLDPEVFSIYGSAGVEIHIKPYEDADTEVSGAASLMFGFQTALWGSHRFRPYLYGQVGAMFDFDITAPSTHVDDCPGIALGRFEAGFLFQF